MQGSYRILNHKADKGFEVTGKSREEVLAGAVKALVSIILDPARVTATGTRAFRINADDWEQLVVRFLNEILYMIDAESFIPARAEITLSANYTLEAMISGEPRATHHTSRTDVKAVTYHQLIFSETAEGFILRVFVDI
jgi:SHS2 domain-containing protein